MAAWIPDSAWKLLPDSIGGWFSAVVVVLFWILRRLALNWSEGGSSPYRGLLCSATAFFGVVAFVSAALTLVALYHIQGFGMVLVLASAPVFFVSSLFSRLCYRAACDQLVPQKSPHLSQR